MTEPAGGQGGKTAKAIAIQNDLDSDDLPKIVATGQGVLAEQILEIAFANGIKVREDADLAELLSAVDVDSPIPVEALAAVAEILVYVYRANHLLSDGSDLPGQSGTPQGTPT